MGFLDKLFGSKKKEESKQHAHHSGTAAPDILKKQTASFQQKAQAKDRGGAITEGDLLKTFAEYFAPNREIYSSPGSPKFTAYFGVVNAARDEMLRNPALFTAATKWTPQQLADMMNSPKPGVTNMMICGLIFAMGDYAVIKDALYCVDFCEKIPNCIALYLFLIAQKLPAGDRKMLLDTGDGCDSTALSRVIASLKVCDPDWVCRIA